MEIEELLTGTPFADAEIVPVSSLTGDGVDSIQDKLLALAAEHETHSRPHAAGPLAESTSVPSLKGLGVVITGTLGERRCQPG